MGILGAIIGKTKSMEQRLLWYEDLNDVKIAIELLNTNFIRFKVDYNNSIGYGYEIGNKKGKEAKGQTLNIREQVLVNPKYRIYVELNEKTNQIFDLLKNNRTVFTPYLGKNEFRCEITDLKKEKLEKFSKGKVVVSSIFPIEGHNFDSIIDPFKDIILESYPYSYNKDYLYNLRVFAYSTKEINIADIEKRNRDIGSFFKVIDSNKIIYVF